MAGGKIDCYLDVASFYSHMVFIQLLKNKELLASHNVEIEFHPVFIGGIMHKSGNKPPWLLPAKAKYSVYDARRSLEHAGGNVEFWWPDNFFERAKTLLPMRAMHFIKATYPQNTFEAAFSHLFDAFWRPPHQYLAIPEVLKGVLSTTPSGDDQGSKKPLFTADEVDGILAAASTQKFKDALIKATDDALAKGAFGAPWLWVRNQKGQEEPFFGSDRFHFVYKFLGVPFRPVELLPAPDSTSYGTSKRPKL